MENTVPNFNREEGKNIREFPAGIKRETKNKCEREKGKRIPPENGMEEERQNTVLLFRGGKIFFSEPKGGRGDG